MEENQTPTPAVEPAPRDEKAGARAVFLWIETFVLTFAILLCAVTFLVRYAPVEGSSMYPTLENGDLVLLSNLGGAPKTGDIIVVQSEHYGYDKPLVKRVIATGGQTVQIDPESWEVRVDGVLLDESYVNRESKAMVTVRTEWKVPQGKLFVMGDNRNYSLDSRSSQIGYVDERLVMGKVFFRLFPFARIGSLS